MMIMFQFIENIERIEWDIILWGAIFIFPIYLLTIILNIRITKGEFGITPGRFKAYCIAALFGVISNFADRLVYLYKVDWEISPVIKVVASFWVLYKLWKLSRYGDPRWHTGDEDSENKDPFSTTHKPVAILDGRDGKTLKEWLSKNKHVKAVTRDRASAYSAAIKEILPDAMQIADRFHLHQNLLEAIRNTINSVLPVDIRIPSDSNSIAEPSVENDSKKNAM